MKRITVKRGDTSYFGGLSNQLTYQQDILKKYIQAPVNLANFKAQIELKKAHFTNEKRVLLHEVLVGQLSAYFHHNKVKENVDLLLKDNTFTVIAGHQLNLYGGPLYTIYKIMDAIRLAEELSKKYPEYNFVPVFWMATEDHDFEEINHLHLFGETLTWNSEQVGPVGRFNLDGFEEVKDAIQEKFQNNPNFAAFLDKFYKNGSLTDATVETFMELVGEEYGLVIIDGDSQQLKASFAGTMRKEIETPFAEKLIAETTQQLEADGYHGQAHARPINLFYIKDQLREHIIALEDGSFEAGELRFSKEEILNELSENPQRFSPNVVFRPLYQESVLPNLCYLGGGGEMAYWLQLKAMFEEAAVPYPLIKVRNSVQWLDKTTVKRLDKLSFEVTDIFESIHELKKRFVFENSGDELDFSVLESMENQLIAEVEKTVLSVDKGLDGYVKGEIVRLQKQLDNLKQKLVREQKKKHENAMGQIDGIYEKMFPGNGLQERYENMIPYLAKYGVKEYISMVHDIIDPFENDLIVVLEE